jgi:hypothetical protein
MKRFAIPLLLATVVLAVLAPSASAKSKFKFFESPSGNIGCVIFGGGVRCDIRNHQWPTPPKPPSCDVDYGQGVSVGRHNKAGFVCAGDTTFDPGARVLGYGERIRVKRFRCASKQKGMRCVNRRNGHGFFLSAQDVRLF